MGGITADVTVDSCGTCCPTPLLELTRAVRRMKAGEIVELIATDIGSRMDIPLWCGRTGQELVSQEEHDGRMYYFIRKRR